jgi:Tol biopolymer transport system component
VNACRSVTSPTVTILIALSLVMAACSRVSGAPAVSSGSRVVPSSTTEASTRSPVDVASLSGRIVFDNSQDIWSIKADGTGLRRLTRSPWREFDPSWSPDRRFIVYRSEPSEYPQLWVMKADGSGKHRLTRDGGFPDWSPGCSMIAYALAGGSSGRSSIAIMNADGSGRRRVLGTDYGEYPSLSPDCKRVAFNSNVTGGPLMYIADVDRSRVVPLAGAGDGGQVAWSPDGLSILFASDRDHSDYYKDIYVMGPDGSDVERLTHVRAETPAWSPDGRYIVFGAPEGLGLARAEGSGVTFLRIEGAGSVSFPDWR